ncbi:hypothetical protein TNCV_2912731 [Trichonephila clavipes]|nr:hypothetical protein TNCV_2912731 [Trichonephila clavipes]
MSLLISRNAYQHVSDFEKARTVAYWDCGLSYRTITVRIGRVPMTVDRIIGFRTQQDSCIRVWWHRGERTSAACIRRRHTGPSPSVMPPSHKSTREVSERGRAPDHLQDVLAQNWGGNEPNHTVICLVLKAMADDRRTTKPFAMMNRGRGSLVVKVTDSLLACHEFEPSAAEDPHSRVNQCTLNLSRLKHPFDVVMGKLGERAGSHLKCRLRHLIMVQNYEVCHQKPSSC